MQNLDAITLPESDGKIAKQIWEGEKSIKKNSVPSPSPESDGKIAKQIWEGENLKTTLKFEYFTRFYAHSQNFLTENFTLPSIKILGEGDLNRGFAFKHHEKTQS